MYNIFKVKLIDIVINNNYYIPGNRMVCSDQIL